MIDEFGRFQNFNKTVFQLSAKNIWKSKNMRAEEKPNI
jgi:hypothetical protein